MAPYWLMEPSAFSSMPTSSGSAGLLKRLRPVSTGVQPSSTTQAMLVGPNVGALALLLSPIRLSISR